MPSVRRMIAREPFLPSRDLSGIFASASKKAVLP
jgi:hypothetical protein